MRHHSYESFWSDKFNFNFNVHYMRYQTGANVFQSVDETLVCHSLNVNESFDSSCVGRLFFQYYKMIFSQF